MDRAVCAYTDFSCVGSGRLEFDRGKTLTNWMAVVVGVVCTATLVDTIPPYHTLRTPDHAASNVILADQPSEEPRSTAAVCPGTVSAAVPGIDPQLYLRSAHAR